MIRQAVVLWRQERLSRGTTMQRRLILFFACIAAFVILLFTAMLMLFGITGSEKKLVEGYVSNELAHASDSISYDFGRLSVAGVAFAKAVSASCDNFFEENGISPQELAEHPLLLEPLLDKAAGIVLSVVENNTCGGAYILLDATVNPEAKNADSAKSGVFIKKLQPESVQSVGVKTHYLRGPAQIARDNGIELMGQWRMEYDITGEEFFTGVMEKARENPELPLSRLYYWSGRVVLAGNSESGFLLCVPLRSEDGAVFGLCGIEISDRMFKQLYSPKGRGYQNLFVVASPNEDGTIHSELGLLAGNSYLTGNRMEESLTELAGKDGFQQFGTSAGTYGGMSQELALYPLDSPYRDCGWTVAVLMPEGVLEEAVRGNSNYLFIIVLILLTASLLASIFISRHYLRPVSSALAAIRGEDYAGSASGSEGSRYAEINDLFAFLSERDKQHDVELHDLEQKRQEAEQTALRAKKEVVLLAGKKRQEIDRECYAHFLSNLKTLTKREREIFNMYMEGMTAKQIVEKIGFTEHTLKYHNGNIYLKLGVASRKQLMQYIALMNADSEKNI